MKKTTVVFFLNNILGCIFHYPCNSYVVRLQLSCNVFKLLSATMRTF